MKKHNTHKEDAVQEAVLKVLKAYRSTVDGFSLRHYGQLKVIITIWLESKDVSFMDAAISYCYQNSLPILPELNEHLHNAMQRRVRNGTSPRKAFRFSHRERLFEEMGKLIYCGATLQKASERAALISSETPFPMKASSLNKEFAPLKDEYIERAKALFEDKSLTQSDREKYMSQWRAVIDESPSLPNSLKGERR